MSPLAWEGANIDNLLAASVRDSSVGKGHDPKNDKSDSNKRDQRNTHRVYSFVF